MCIASKTKRILCAADQATGKVGVEEGRFVIQHSYHDHANESCDNPLHCLVPCRGGVLKPFPIKLYEMLNTVEEEGNGDIVSWQPHGRCFVVRKPKEFLQKILPKYFKHSKMDSFQRQLNLYGFLRLTQGRDEGGYYHELFLRGKKFLATKIQRRKVKGTRVRARSNPSAEPNFWLMNWVGCGTATAAAIGASGTSAAATSSIMVHNSGSALGCFSLGNRNIFSSLAHIGETVSSSSIHTELVTSTPSKPETRREAMILPSEMLSNSCVPTQFSEEEMIDDTLCSFGGRHFHCVDPSLQAPQNGHNTASLKNDDEKVTFLSELRSDNLLDNITEAQENTTDDSFMGLLAHICS